MEFTRIVLILLISWGIIAISFIAAISLFSATVTEYDVGIVYVYEEECVTNSTTTAAGSPISISQSSSVSYSVPSNYPIAIFRSTTTIGYGESSIVTVSNSSLSALPTCPPQTGYP